MNGGDSPLCEHRQRRGIRCERRRFATLNLLLTYVMFPSVEEPIEAHCQLDFAYRGATSHRFKAALPQCHDGVVRRGGWLWRNGFWVEEGGVVVKQKGVYGT